MSNIGKHYRDRQNDERRIVYWLKRHLNRLPNILIKVERKDK